MQYFGGKARLAKDITNYLKAIRKEGQTYIEPFVGGGWIMEKMDGERYGYDKHPYLIAMYQALQNGWIPPTEITEEQWRHIKDNKDDEPYLTGFVGFGCSYAGRFFEGYARGRDRNYCLSAHNSILRKMNNMKDVKFDCLDYRDVSPKDALIYCDPPYRGVKWFSGLDRFNSDDFWNTMREWSKDNTVVISEYQAPDDFVEVWRKNTRTDIRNGNNIREERIEKLFVHNDVFDKIH
jgi:DNA adenine methylase